MLYYITKLREFFAATLCSFLVYAKTLISEKIQLHNKIKNKQLSSNLTEQERIRLRRRMFAQDQQKPQITINFNSIFSWDQGIEQSKLRLLIVVSCFSFCFIILAYRLMLIATTEHKARDGYAKIGSFRKEIVDRNGNLLAVNLPSASLFANPRKVVDPEKSLQKLAKILPDIDKAKLLAELKSQKNFVWIKRDISPKLQTEIFDLGLPGFDFEREYKRVYTFGNLLSHPIGYVGRDFTGLAGLEKSYEPFLTNSELKTTKADPAQPLELTIDVRLQNILSEEIERIQHEFKATGAVGIVADPNSGEILAMVSKPDFDPHHPYAATPEQLFNRASLGVYEAGSIFKGLTMAVGFETNVISFNDVYDVSYMKVGNKQLKDYHPHHGWYTVPEIFLHSSNIGVGQIILEIGKENFKKHLKNLGLLDQLKIDLPERAVPLFPADNRWDDLTLITVSYGYAISISPLHFVQAMLPVVNGGIFYPLTLTKDKNAAKNGRQVLSSKTSKEMLKLMRVVVQAGTGKKAEVPGYLVGGKTGTAEMLVGGRYVKDRRRSSFFGVMPASNPKYVIYIMFDDPKGTKESFGFATSGYTAAPAAGRVFERMVSLYGLQKEDENDPEVQNLINIKFKVDNEV